MPTKSAIQKWLDGDYVRFNIRIDGTPMRGCIRAVPMKMAIAEQLILDHQDDAERHDYQLFCGTSYILADKVNISATEAVQVFAVHHTSQAQIAALCQVGEPLAYNSPALIRRIVRTEPNSVITKAVKSGMVTVNQVAGPSPLKRKRAVRGFLESAYEYNPFRIWHADKRGLAAKFIDPVDAEDARWMEEEIAMFNIESFEVVAPLTMRDFIRKKQAFRLSWH